MARNNDFENKSFSNLKPDVIKAWTNKSELRRFGREDNIVSMSVNVGIKNHKEETEYQFLELRFFDERADAIEANFGEGGPLSGGGVPILITPGPLFIQKYEGELGSKFEPFVITIDDEEYSSEDVRMRGERIRYSMNPVELGVSLMTNVVNDGFEMEYIFSRAEEEDDDDEEGGRGGRGGRSSSRRSKRSSSRTSRRSRREEKEDEDDYEESEDEDAEDEDFEESEDADEDFDDVEEEEERPRSRSSRRGRSGRRSSSRRGRR